MKVREVLRTVQVLQRTLDYRRHQTLIQLLKKYGLSLLLLVLRDLKLIDAASLLALDGLLFFWSPCRTKTCAC